MLTLARRLFWLAVLSGAGYAVYTAWQRRNEPVPDGRAEWPPIDDAFISRPSGAPLPDLGGDAGGRAPLPDLGGDVDRDAWSTRSAPDTTSTDTTNGTQASAAWVAPVDGQCPSGYPIKGNANSGIYHVPGGRFYERTVPERCYATEDDAIADGYRRAKA